MLNATTRLSTEEQIQLLLSIASHAETMAATLQELTVVFSQLAEELLKFPGLIFENSLKSISQQSSSVISKDRSGP
jgi:hypothetical protein